MSYVPLSGTDIRLMTGVPFNNDYKNTRWFNTKTEQTNYFLSKSTTYRNLKHTFQKIDGLNSVKVNASIDELWGTNYLMFQNSEYNSKWFYAFVTKLEYLQANTTKVYFEIDVLQTWKFEMNFKPSFVVREHCPLWNSDGSPVVNTIDEGLNYGSEYETVKVENVTPFDDLLFLVIVAKSALHGSATATINKITPNMNGIPQPLSYYVHPFKRNGSALQLKINGTDHLLTSVNDTLKGIFSYDDAVNNIVSLYVTEYFGKVPISYDGTNLDFDGFAFEAADIAEDGHPTVNTMYLKNIWDYDSTTMNTGNKYDGFTSVKESKLLMYPYTVTLLDDFKGNRIELKNEYIKRTDLVLRVRGSLGTSNKVAYSLDDYNINTALDSDGKLKGSMEYALINNSPNDISILSDYLSAYLQGNRNTIEHQKSTAMFNATFGAITAGMIGMSQSTFHKGNKLVGNPFGVGAAGLEAVRGVADSVIEIQGLMAKQQDISNTPPQLVKMGGNTSFDYGNGYNGVYVIKKQITSEYRNKLTSYFNMFGYKVNEVKLPNFHTRKYWNYVQTNGCNILGNFNNEDLVELKKVFDNGITLWHTDDVGNYALENEVI